MTVRRKAVAISHVLGEVLSTLTPTAQKKGVVLHIDAGPFCRSCTPTPSACGRSS